MIGWPFARRLRFFIRRAGRESSTKPTAMCPVIWERSSAIAPACSCRVWRCAVCSPAGGGYRCRSLTFAEPIIPDNISFHDLIETAIRYGRGAGWRSLELRAGRSLPADIPASTSYYHHALDLSQGENGVFMGLRESTRRNIRKSERSGVEVARATSRDAVREFYRLNCMTRKMHMDCRLSLTTSSRNSRSMCWRAAMGWW